MIGKRLGSLLRSIRNTGLLTTLVYKLDRIRLSAGVPATGLLKLQPTGVAQPLELRRGKSSDMEVYRAIFIEREYDAVEPESLPSLILDLGANIEDSERQLFSTLAQDWLPLVRNICIELHGRECEEVFFQALEKYQYKSAVSGELTLCTGLRPPPNLEARARRNP